MWELSPSWADFLFDLSNIVLVFGAAAVLIGTIGSIKMAGIKEQFSNERISANEAETERAKADAAIANARAAEANVALEKFKAPRTLPAEQQRRITEKINRSAGTVFDIGLQTGDPEAEGLLNPIETALKSAGWTQIDWRGGDVVLSRTGRPICGIVSLIGLVIQMSPTKVEEYWPAATALAEALNSEGISAKAEPGSAAQAENADAMHILIGKKP